MRLKSVLAFAGAIACATGAVWAADVPSDAQAAITANYALTCTAVLDPSDANLDGAFAMMGPDFVATDTKGKTHERADVIANVKQQLKTLHATVCTNKLDGFTLVDPNTINVTVSQHIEGDLQAPDGKHEIVVTQKAADVWKLVSGKWLQSGSKDLRVLVKIDGNVAQDDGGD